MIRYLSFPVIFVTQFAAHASAQEPPDEALGKEAYQANCMACHQADLRLVGPSLVAIAETYPLEKEAEFIQWAKAPGKKDPKLLQMPPMSHLPDETLAAIHKFMLGEAKGKTEQKAGSQYDTYKEPVRELPYVVRAFLPDASPASVAVVLKDGISLCWDTEACRFRYAWAGDKTRLRQGHTVVNLRQKPFYRESAPALWSFAGDDEPQFHGYRLHEDGTPEFAYSFGDIEIRERISNGAEAGSFVRHFTLSKPLEKLSLNLEQDSSARVSADKGELNNHTLTLTAGDTKSFTLTISKP
ncbi:c-type cytochrome [Luteolibacter algae]|uniref:C-type cytochrome n=1 Tax=Luteolibacter algae TaxID=454151 RepID=A0ABW5D328_9BACT